MIHATPFLTHCATISDVAMRMPGHVSVPLHESERTGGDSEAPKATAEKAKRQSCQSTRGSLADGDHHRLVLQVLGEGRPT